MMDYFLRHKIVESVNFDFNLFSFKLTKAGFDILKQYIANEEVYTFVKLKDNKKIANKSVTFSQYQMKDKLLNHQVHLNNAVIGVFEKVNEIDDINRDSIVYMDEKNFMPDKNINTRPDGVLMYTDKEQGLVTMYFLEMDMSTESVHQLSQKWNGYYELIKQLAGVKSNNKVIINTIFIGLDEERLKVVKEGLYSHISLITQSNIEFSLVTESIVSDFIIDDMTKLNINEMLGYLKHLLKGYDIKPIDKANILTNGHKNYIVVLADEVNNYKLTQLSLIKKYITNPEYSFLFILKEEELMENKDRYKLIQLVKNLEIDDEEFNQFKSKLYFTNFEMFKKLQALQVVNSVSFESEVVNIQ